MLDNRETIRGIQSRIKSTYEQFKSRHRSGCDGPELCRAISDSRDAMLLDLMRPTWDAMSCGGEFGGMEFDSPDSPIALVALGGSGRRDVAPFSDVDLMMLYRSGGMIGERVEDVARQYFRDVYDTGLQLGHSVRTVDQACSLARQDTQIGTSLIDARLIGGNATLLDEFQRKFDRLFRGGVGRWLTDIVQERANEQHRFGETVYLLEPNIKRTRGGLRDLQLLRWIAKVRYGTTDLSELVSLGVLADEDRTVLEEVKAYLLTLRNELHFATGRGSDVLDMAQQQRIAEQRGYEPIVGMMQVERFMRHHFRRTGRVSHLVERFVSQSKSTNRVTELMTRLLGHKASRGLQVGPHCIIARSRGLHRLREDWTSVLELVDLANLYDKQVHPDTWEAVYRRYGLGLEWSQSGQEPEIIELGEPAVRHFCSLLSHPGRLGRLGRLLRDLHNCGLLERVIPQFTHARGLLQFNQYHKYTVDEHCFRAVDAATDLLSDESVLGQVYRHISQKLVLHLALLIHDLGKGRIEDHHELGETIAEEVAVRLRLNADQVETLRFLVRNHELMNHLAFRRDTSDEQLVIRFAVDVKSPERLRMLLVMTASDLAAVGPGVMDSWKADVLADLYRRTMQHLAGQPESSNETDEPNRRRAQLDPLGLLIDLPDDQVRVHVDYRPETETLQITVAAHEQATDGVFHRLTGALSGKGLRVLSAEINTLEPGLVLDRFVVTDPDFSGAPTPDRLGQIEQAVRIGLIGGEAAQTVMRRTWQSAQQQKNGAIQVARTAVQVDNSTSDRFTVLDIFASDRPGLLHRIAESLYELGLSVHRAKVGTYVDQVVDVFYLVDASGQKIEGDVRLQQVRYQLMQCLLASDE